MTESASPTKARADQLALVDQDERTEVMNHVLNTFRDLSVKGIITPEYDANIRHETGLPSKLDVRMTTYHDINLDVILTSILSEIYNMRQITPTYKTVYQNGETSISITYEFQN
jgi:hypothetical protein